MRHRLNLLAKLQIVQSLPQGLQRKAQWTQRIIYRSRKKQLTIMCFAENGIIQPIEFLCESFVTPFVSLVVNIFILLGLSYKTKPSDGN